MAAKFITRRATKRPKPFAKPAHWDNAPPPASKAAEHQDPEGLSPTRYGDWVKNGLAIDF